MSQKSILYEYAVIWHPTKEQEEKGEKSKILTSPTTILAKDQATAQMYAVRGLTSDQASDLDQIQIAIRPF